MSSGYLPWNDGHTTFLLEQPVLNSHFEFRVGVFVLVPEAAGRPVSVIATSSLYLIAAPSHLQHGER
jgi:hypothetical protein